MSNLISIRELQKSYGKNMIFDDFDMTIELGKIIGLLGPNGSGKTTLIKILAGLLTYSKGEIEIDGNKIGSKTKDIVAYLPDRIYFNDNQKVGEIIKVFKTFYRDFDVARAEERNMNSSDNRTVPTVITILFVLVGVVLSILVINYAMKYRYLGIQEKVAHIKDATLTDIAIESTLIVLIGHIIISVVAVLMNAHIINKKLNLQ